MTGSGSNGRRDEPGRRNRRWERSRLKPPRGSLASRLDRFAVLGLDRHAELTDDDVRVAWRRLAAATHPDRADGGAPERFAAAAAAYTELRTRYGRGEARAGLNPESRPARPAAIQPRRLLAVVRAAMPASVIARVRSGRVVRLLLRVLVAAGAASAGVLAAGPSPAAPAIATGAITWLLLTARRDLGPPTPR